MASDLPAGWSEVPFQDAIDFREGPGILAKDFRADGVPLIRLKGLTVGSRLTDGCNFLDPAMVEKTWSHFRVQPGDTLLSTSATLGRVKVVAADEGGGVPYTGIVRMRPADKALLGEFIRFLLESPHFQRQVEAMGVGSVIRHFGPMHLRQMSVVVPPLDEQRRIAAVLGALDDKIELNRKMNRTLEEMAQAIFKSWFIDFDGHDPADMVDSELGPIPRGWRVANLGTLCSKIGSGATPRGGGDAYVESGTSFIRSQNVYDFDFDWGGLVRLTEQDAHRLRGVTVEQGDVLINITGDSILRTCVVDPAVLPARVNQHVAIIRPEPPLASPVLHLHLVHPRMKSWLLGHSAGATRKAVTKGHLESVPVVLPPEQDLVQVGASLAPLYAKRAVNWAESRTLAALRDALLPKLISGEIRVPEAEAVASEVL